MRKKVFSSVFALALLATAGWGVNKSMSNDAGLSDLALSNVEALADDENPPLIKYFGLYLECFDSRGNVIGRQYKCYLSSQGNLDNCTDITC